MEEKEVKIVRSWSFIGFAKLHGQPKLAPCKNGETGDKFFSLAFDDKGDITWCHFGRSIQDNISDNPNDISKWLSKNAKDLKVGETTSNKFTLYKQGENAWQDIAINWDEE